jgi:hypothetical protein
VITLEQAREHGGGLVAYRPRGQHDAPEEYGRIVRVSSIYVFVNFGTTTERWPRFGRIQGEPAAQACYPEDLRLVDVVGGGVDVEP